MSSGTTIRVLSGIVMAISVVICLLLGKLPTILFATTVAILIADELFCNFLKKRRFSFLYILIQLVLLVLILLRFTVPAVIENQIIIVYLTIVVNVFMLFYLFGLNIKSKFVPELINQIPLIIPLFIFLEINSLFHLASYSSMASVFIVLMVINFGMDTGAYIFGKNFGKHKLWPTVSPNKTIEGLAGGSITAAISGVIASFLLFDEISWVMFILFLCCGLISQTGDLVQSKLKRQFEIKDSSALIPGHGGVYDRIDSLIFLSPFFIISLQYIGLYT